MDEELKREPCAGGEECPCCMVYIEDEYGHRRTCQFIKNDYFGWTCDRCGEFQDHITDYCRYCGAKVVK